MLKTLIPVIDAAISLLEMVLDKAGDKLPEELVKALQAAIDAWASHKDAVTTSAAKE